MKPTDQSQPHQRPNKKNRLAVALSMEWILNCYLWLWFLMKKSMTIITTTVISIFIRATIDKGNSLWFYVLQYNESEIKLDIYYCVMSNGDKHQQHCYQHHLIESNSLCFLVVVFFVRISIQVILYVIREGKQNNLATIVTRLFKQKLMWL